ncbi:MAG: hypothetical protein OXK16_04205 [bacterium]|nr:hypothetical protein [bacterium]
MGNDLEPPIGEECQVGNSTRPTASVNELSDDLVDRILEQTVKLAFIKGTRPIGSGVWPDFHVQISVCFIVQCGHLMEALFNLLGKFYNAKMAITITIHLLGYRLWNRQSY